MCAINLVAVNQKIRRTFYDCNLNIKIGTINALMWLIIFVTTIKKTQKGLKMQLTDENICLNAFNALCKDLATSKLVGLEECQYWLFERGYNAAVEELIQNIAVAANMENSTLLEQTYLAKKPASL